MFADQVPFAHHELCVLVSKKAITEHSNRRDLLDNHLYVLDSNQKLVHITAGKQLTLARRKGDPGLGLMLLSPVEIEFKGQRFQFAASTGKCSLLYAHAWIMIPNRNSKVLDHMKTFMHEAG